MRAAIAFFACLSFASLASGQGTPAGVYRLPGESFTWAYESTGKDLVSVTIHRVEDPGSRSGEQIGSFSVPDGMVRGVKSNVEKWARKQKPALRLVTMIGNASAGFEIYVTPLMLAGKPAASKPRGYFSGKSLEEPYVKGVSPAPDAPDAEPAVKPKQRKLFDLSPR